MAKELSPAEVQEFEEWKATKAARKVKSTARRKALADLKVEHKVQYNQLVKRYGG